MTDSLVRDDIIRTLERLGGDQDEEVLEAARQVHAQVMAAGLTWNELLVPDGTRDEADDSDDSEFPDLEDEDFESPDLEDEDSESSDEKESKNAESLKLIDKLLARSNISKDLREELGDYKKDIVDGEFEEMDRRYLRALYKRLS